MKRLKTFKQMRPTEGTSSDPNSIPLESIGGKDKFSHFYFLVVLCVKNPYSFIFFILISVCFDSFVCFFSQYFVLHAPIICVDVFYASIVCILVFVFIFWYRYDFIFRHPTPKQNKTYQNHSRISTKRTKY